MIETFNGADRKAITLANLFAIPPVNITTYTASGAIAATDSVAILASSTPATTMVMTIAAPAAGRVLVITQDDAGTAGHTVTLTAGNWNGGANTIATFDARNETLLVVGLSTTRFLIISNTGSVAIS